MRPDEMNDHRMHARVTYSTTDPTQAPERLRFIKERVAPSASSREGFKAGYWMSDPATGKGLAITFWESEAAMLAIAGMAGEALLFSIAQIAIATTGFAGIVSALVRDKWTQGHALRFNGLITASLSAAMLSLLPSLICRH